VTPVLIATIKGMAAHPLRLILTALSIALGVAFLSGTMMLTDSMQRSFDEVFGQVTSGTDVAVRGEMAFVNSDVESPPIPAALLDTVSAVDGVAVAEGGVQGYAVIIGADGAPIEGSASWGGSLNQDPELRGEVTVRSGRAPEAPGEVAIDATSAKESGLSLGSQTRILFQGPAETFTVVGTVGFADQDDLGGITSAYFDLATAQRVLGKVDVYDTINVRAASDIDEADLVDRIAAVLPAQVEALTGEALAAESSTAVQEDLKFVSVAMTIFAGIALFVGSFIIWNTFSMQVAQRTRELALLRAIGATRRQVMRTIVAEAAALGLVASALGLGLGIGAAYGLSSLLSAFGPDLPTTTMRLQGGTIAISLIVGTLVTTIAAIAPARRATRILPVEALHDAATGVYRFSHRRLVAGVVISSTGVGALLAGLFAGAPVMFIAVGVVAVILGVGALAPLVARPLARIVGAPLHARGMPGELAMQNAMRNPKRTASTAMALVIGLAMVMAVTVFGASLKASFHDVLGNSTKADLYLRTASQWAPGFSPEVADTVRGTPGVDVVSRAGWGEARFDGDIAQFSSVDPATIEQVAELGIIAGQVSDLSETAMLVSRKKADEMAWQVGDVVPVEFAQTGESELQVAGIFTEKSWFQQDYLISLSLHQITDPGMLDSSALVTIDAGADLPEVESLVAAALLAHPDVQVLDQDEMAESGAEFADQILGFVTVLLLLAVVIALLGIVNTLALSVFERTRELGLLRAVGMTRNQVRAMVRWESVVISVIGAVIGAALGIGLGISLARALADLGIKTIAIPTGQLAIYVALAGIAGVLAAIGPARRAAKVDVLRAVVTE
jgi:putative ABC transport system permease protein